MGIRVTVHLGFYVCVYGVVYEVVYVCDCMGLGMCDCVWGCVCV